MAKHSKQHAGSKRQKGNTLLGLIAGIIIGLAIAVVVALLLKGGPVPFAGRSVKADKEIAVAASTEKRARDPNEPMYQKRDLMDTVAGEVARKVENEGRSAIDVLNALAPLLGRQNDAPSAAPAAATPAAVPPPVVMNQKADKPATNVVSGLIYYLQVGAFRNKADADSIRGKVALMGYSASVYEVSAENGTLYRVRLGPYSQIAEMNPIRSKLAENGMESVVVRP